MVRALAGGIALAVLVTLILRAGITMDERGAGLADALWRMAKFFTIWTNTAVGVTAALIAWRGSAGQQVPAALVLSIAAVGLVYHILLAPEVPLVGLDLIVDHMMHTVLPILWIAYWATLLPKDRLRFARVPLWLAWPLAYCAYGLVRGRIEGDYPYFFLDLGALGPAGVAAWVAALTLAFALGAALIVLGARAARR